MHCCFCSLPVDGSSLPVVESASEPCAAAFDRRCVVLLQCCCDYLPGGSRVLLLHTSLVRHRASPCMVGLCRGRR